MLLPMLRFAVNCSCLGVTLAYYVQNHVSICGCLSVNSVSEKLKFNFRVLMKQKS
jgi:hypothetical protein